MPVANLGGVSNAGPVEETTVARADGTVEEVQTPEPEEAEKPKPTRTRRK